MLNPPDKIVRPMSLGNALKHEYDRDFTRETRTLKASNSAPVCTLVGEIAETDARGDKKLVPWDPAANTGAEVAVGMVVGDYEAPAGIDNDLVLTLVRGPAILFGRGIAWPAGATDNQKKAAAASLKARSILVR